MRLGKRMYSLLLFFVVAGLGGVLVAGLFAPAAAGLIAGSAAAADTLEYLPAELETPPQAERSRILNADGSTLAYLYDANRVNVTLDKIAPVMQQAQVAIEDHRFYEHGAIDLTGTLRAAFANLQGVPQGGSGLTQQLVRLVQVEEYTTRKNAAEGQVSTAEAKVKAATTDAKEDPSDAAAAEALAAANAELGKANEELAKANEALILATETTIARKVREMRYAVAVEKKYTKDQILEMYLNISYYGDGAYGVEAAARHYFNTTAAELTLPQAAMLAGIVQNPYALNPVKNPKMAIERRNVVISRMLELKYITADQAAEAKVQEFDATKIRESRTGCANSKYPFICDYALKTLLAKATSLGSTREEREDRIYRGGLTIQTTIDLKVQNAAQKAITKRVSPKDPAIAVTTMVEPGTGKILAMAQSRPKMGTNKKAGETFYNYAVERVDADGNRMGGTDGFLAGSTFKAFTAAAALEEGLGAYGRYDAKQRLNDLPGTKYETCDGTATVGNWRPANAGSGRGFINMFQGTSGSVNNYFVQLELAVGMCPVVKMAKKLGLTRVDGTKDVMTYQDKPAFTLGTATVPPLTLSAAYATFGSRGTYCQPIIIDSIKSKDGKELEVPSANCERVISKGVADAMNRIFQGPYNGGTASSAKVSGLQMAGKTGTLNDYKAIWTMGYTPNLAGGSMLSVDPDPAFKSYWKKHSRNLGGVRLPYSKTYVRGSSGSNAGAWFLKPTFQQAIKTRSKKRFSSPPSSVLNGRRVTVPSCEGLSVNACKSALTDAGFSVSTKKVDSEVEKDLVVSTTPSGKAAIKSQIMINISKGPKEKPIESVEPDLPPTPPVTPPPTAPVTTPPTPPQTPPAAAAPAGRP